MKATEQYFPVVLHVYYAVQVVQLYHSNETATERYFLMEVPQKGLSLKANCAFYGDRWVNVKRPCLLICLLSVFQWHLTINTRNSYYQTLK